MKRVAVFLLCVLTLDVMAAGYSVRPYTVRLAGDGNSEICVKIEKDEEAEEDEVAEDVEEVMEGEEGKEAEEAKEAKEGTYAKRVSFARFCHSCVKSGGDEIVRRYTVFCNGEPTKNRIISRLECTEPFPPEKQQARILKRDAQKQMKARLGELGHLWCAYGGW